MADCNRADAAAAGLGAAAAAILPEPQARRDAGLGPERAAPVAQAHWHTRTQGKLPDDVWTQTDSLLEKAEMVDFVLFLKKD